MCTWNVTLLLLACASCWPITHIYGFLLSSFLFAGGPVATRQQHHRRLQREILFKRNTPPRVRYVTSSFPLFSAPPSTSTPPSSPDPFYKLTASILKFYANLDNLYSQSMSIKCPFLRRRVADAIDGTAMLMQFLLIRHKSLHGISDLILDGAAPHTNNNYNMLNAFFACPGCKPLGRHIQLRNPDGTPQKRRHLPISSVADIIQNDWTGGCTGVEKGYYITGKLDSTVYRDDCLFVGPDPDMPVRRICVCVVFVFIVLIF